MANRQRDVDLRFAQVSAPSSNFGLDRRVFSQHPQKAPRRRITHFHTHTHTHTHPALLLRTSQVIPKLSSLPNRPRLTHSRIYIYIYIYIYIPYQYMNNLYLIFIESSETVYGRDIVHSYPLYMIPCWYNNYFVSIVDPTVRLTSLVIGSVFFEGLKMTR